MFKLEDTKKKILLVDDDKSVTDMLTLLLETRGYDVTVANTAKEALCKATNGIDLTILDVVLPDAEGFQVCRKLKENSETCDISIIILTGKQLTQDVVEGLYLGADDYLTKPFEFEELVARIEAVMRRRPSHSQEVEDVSDQNDIVVELRKIIDNELIVPYFQPIFLLNPLQLYGFEGLSRPQTEGVLCAPDKLFKTAIQYGVYQDLEMLVWRQALEYATKHIDGKKLFLNCNPYLVEGSKFEVIRDLFEKNHMTINNVYLEITERSAIRNYKVFYENLNIYKNYGFKFAVDDVGGGFASLESIVELRPEVVKIDRHIVHQLDQDPLRRSIVKFIVGLCKENGIFCIAEGIETKEDFKIVQELGVDAGQGYYFQKPAPCIDSTEIIMQKINNL